MCQRLFSLLSAFVAWKQLDLEIEMYMEDIFAPALFLISLLHQLTVNYFSVMVLYIFASQNRTKMTQNMPLCFISGYLVLFSSYV